MYHEGHDNINPDPPFFDPIDYPGRYYPSMVPATLDLVERARLYVSGTIETTDPNYDNELYWIVDLLAEERIMYHIVDDMIQAMFLQELPLDRTICGSKQNLDVENRFR